MIIDLNDKTIIIEFENKDEEKIIKKTITFKDEKNAFGRNGFDIKRIRDVCMGKDIKDKKTGKTYFVCFSGLAKEILMACKENKLSVSKFNDNRLHFPFQRKEWEHDELRSFFDPKFKYVEHQIRMLKAMLNTNKGLIKSPTSSGKSKVIIAFMKLTGLRTLILNDRASLASQLYEEIVDSGVSCGINCGGKFKEGYCMVSTIQSVKKLTNLDQFQCILVDEVQRASSASFQDFFKSTSYPLVYGFSASPFNKNANSSYYQFAKIRQFLGSVIIDVGAEELIENGVMAKPNIHIVKCEAPETFDYPSAYDLGVVNNERRNKKIIDIAERFNDGVMILVTHIDHGNILADNIKDSIFVSGNDSLDVRKKAIEDFTLGKIKVLIASDIFKEGISIPAINTLIIASGNKSYISSIQKIGRGLRKRDDKTEAEIYDFYDTGNRFLEKHSRMRIRAYKDEGYEIKDIGE